MDNIVIKVGGVTLPKEVSKFKWKKSDVSAKNAGRTQDVKMHKNRIAKKRTLSLGWVNLTKTQITAILQAFDPEYVMEADVKWWAKGHERYSTLDFDVIER